MPIDEVYKSVITRLLDGVMFHEQMYIHYKFLGLKGNSKCHKYHYLSELSSYNYILEYYIEKYNKLIQVKPSTDLGIEVIPTNWYKFKRTDVDTSNVRTGVKAGLAKWLDWEEHTLKIFKQAYSEVEEDVTFLVILECLIKDVEQEIKSINESIIKNNTIDYDIIFIMSEQDKKYKYYCKKIKEIKFTGNDV